VRQRLSREPGDDCEEQQEKRKRAAPTKAEVRLRFSVINVTNKEALYNSLSTFRGTHFVSPRVPGEDRNRVLLLNLEIERQVG